jgi:hypothetical protein
MTDQHRVVGLVWLYLAMLAVGIVYERVLYSLCLVGAVRRMMRVRE